MSYINGHTIVFVTDIPNFLNYLHVGDTS